jgi:putative membrane protein insertion efficiency factor
MKKPRMQKENVLRRVLRYFYILPSAFCILLVRVYQLTLSPAKTFLLGPTGNCRFEPSCSQYAVEALKTHGAIAGSWLAAKRVCRCHPWGECGHDPVPPIQSKVHPPSPGFGATRSPNSEVQHLDLQVTNVGIRI